MPAKRVIICPRSFSCAAVRSVFSAASFVFCSVSRRRDPANVPGSLGEAATRPSWSSVAKTPKMPLVSIAETPAGDALALADKRAASSRNVPSRLVASPRSAKVAGWPMAAPGMMVAPARPDKARRNARAPLSRASSPVSGSTSLFSSATSSLSALVRSVMKVVTALPGSLNRTAVGAPVLVAVSVGLRPGTRSAIVLEALTIASPSTFSAALAAMPSWRSGSAGVQASAATSGSPVASSTKALFAPVGPLSIKCAPSPPLRT